MSARRTPALLLAVLLLAGERPLPAAEPNDQDSLRVMTFNIRYDNPADGPNAWPHRRDWVAEIIRDNRADIAGLQEALPRQIADLEQRLPEFAWYGVGRDDGRDGGEFVPIFYRKDRFELAGKGTFWLSPTPDEPGSRGWDAALPRTTTWLKLKDRRTGRTFTVFNTHFDHLGRQARLESAKLLLKKIPEIAGDTSVVLTGDFNTIPKTEPYRVLAAAAKPTADSPAPSAAVFKLADAIQISATKPQGPDSTWNGFKEILPGRRIDYVFVSNLPVHSHRTLDDRREGRFPSDHLPILVEIN